MCYHLFVDEQRQSDAVTAAVAAESAKNDTTNQLHQAKLRTLEAELDQLKQVRCVFKVFIHYSKYLWLFCSAGAWLPLFV